MKKNNNRFSDHCFDIYGTEGFADNDFKFSENISNNKMKKKNYFQTFVLAVLTKDSSNDSV